MAEQQNNPGELPQHFSVYHDVPEIPSLVRDGNCVRAQEIVGCVRWKLGEKIIWNCSVRSLPPPIHPAELFSRNFFISRSPSHPRARAHTILWSKARKKTRVLLCKDTLCAHFRRELLYLLLVRAALSLHNNSACDSLYLPLLSMLIFMLSTNSMCVLFLSRTPYTETFRSGKLSLNFFPSCLGSFSAFQLFSWLRSTLNNRKRSWNDDEAPSGGFMVVLIKRQKQKWGKENRAAGASPLHYINKLTNEDVQVCAFVEFQETFNMTFVSLFWGEISCRFPLNSSPTCFFREAFKTLPLFALSIPQGRTHVIK